MNLVRRFGGHIAFGWLVMLAAAALLVPAVLLLNKAQWIVYGAYLVQVGWWLSRERRDTDKDLGLDPHKDYFKGWNIFKWKQGTRDDLLGPVLFNGAFITAPAVYFLRGVS